MAFLKKLLSLSSLGLDKDKPYLFLGAMKRNHKNKNLMEDSGFNIGNYVVGHYGADTIKHSQYFQTGLGSINPKYINKNYSKLIIIATNWFAKYMENLYDYNYLIKKYKKIKIPIVLMGLGTDMSLNENSKDFVRNLSKPMKKFYRTLADMTPSISVRGYFTQEILNLAGIKNTVVTGCPSYYVNGTSNPEIIKKQYRDDFKINFNTNHSYNEIFKKFVNNGNAYFTIQTETMLMELADYQNEIPKNILQAIAKEYGINEENLSKDNKRYVYFDDIENWENYIKQIDFSIGTRIHGAIIALKNGIPAVMIPNDTRTKEMADLFNIPQVAFNTFTDEKVSIRKIYEQADYSKMNEAYPKLLTNYISFLNTHNLVFKGRIFNKETKKQEASLCR